MTIYVSSACVQQDKIADSVRHLAEAGFTHIELSGGTRYYPSYLKDLIHLRQEFGLSYLIHNYFPPPTVDFVINLASCSVEHSAMSMKHVKEAITVSKELGLDKYSVHAGFLINIPLIEVGRQIQKSKLFDRKEAMDVFLSNVSELQAFAGSDFAIYIENNVLSAGNFSRFEQVNPFFLTTAKEYFEMKELQDFRLLLDLAHLKVSCQSLGRSMEDDLKQLMDQTDYIHISDNDGKVDSNKGLKENSEMYSLLKKHDISGKTISLEIYDGMDSLKSSYQLIQGLNTN